MSYQHPGTDNLYWYAQVEFRNVSSQNQNFFCNGVGCPSCIKEHISRGNTYLGYVPAEETFCSRNPNFTAPVKPGEAFNDWVIFHNVPWKGDGVSLEWGSYGASAWVDPWYAPFSAPPPSECPHELVTLGTCVPVSRIPAGIAPNLVVLVHGCCTDENGLKEWDELGRLTAGTIQTPEAWEVVVWDWSFITKICLTFPGCLKVAYDLAPDVGSNLKDAITDAINISFVNSYEYIHFIGHSAGAKLIHEASKKIPEDKTLKKRPFIHLTFLDAYTWDDSDTNSYGSLADYLEHYSEHYVDRSLPSTDAILQNTYNFDITDWAHTPEEDKDSGHQWPRYWYKKSVTSIQTITYSGPFANMTANAKGNVVIDFNTADFSGWPLMLRQP